MISLHRYNEEIRKLTMIKMLDLHGLRIAMQRVFDNGRFLDEYSLEHLTVLLLS
jgi:hypothetical protein